MKVYIFGSNIGSQLAQPSSFDDTHIPVEIPFFHNKTITKIVCGAMHSLALINGELYSWGCNDEGALGRPGDEHEILEVKLHTKLLKAQYAERVVDMSCGASHSVCLTDKGNVYGWGTFRDISGVIGFSPRALIQKEPRKIASGIVALRSCDNYVIMINSRGSLISYGAELYRKKNGKRTCTVKKTYKSNVELKTRIIMRAGKSMPRIRRLYTGSNHCFVMTEDNEIYAWGNNVCGQLGIGNKISSLGLNRVELKNVLNCDGANTHSIFLNTNDELFVCGENHHGQLGIKEKEALLPVRMAEDVRMAVCTGTMNILVKDDGVYGWGANYYGELGYECETIPEIRRIEFNFGKVLMVAAGNNHTVVVSEE